MKRLIIIGASALGREAVSYARDCGMEVKGFLDSREGVLKGYGGYPPILSSVEEYDVEEEDVFVCAVGETDARRRYVESILSRDGQFVSIVHPSAIVGMNMIMGVGCIIRPYAVIGNDVSVGDHVIIGTQSLVAHDCRVDDYVTISPGCHIAGWCKIGEGSFMGLHSALVPHVVTGNEVFVAAGAVVTKSFDSGRVMGVPAVKK